ncbi:MAG: Wzz/FepE/Etk N-terminal domain-containing protein [Pseudonocardiaceae bacterium]
MTGDGAASASAPLPLPLLDLTRLVAGIRWRRRTWISLAVLGLFLGVLLTVLLPPRPMAVTSVLVAHAEDQKADSEGLMQTDVALCQTSEVAGRALKELNINERPSGFLASYQCTSEAPNILTITVDGASELDAVRRAQVIADVVIANHLKRTEDAADAQADALLDRRARLERTLAMLNNSISAATAPAQLEALYTARAGITSQILDLARQVEDARVGIPTVTAGTRLVDPARALPIGLIRSAVTNTFVGLILGLGAGLAVAAVRSVTQDRPVLRRDIAAELGVSIIAQLPSPPRGPQRLWRRSRHVRDRQRAAETLARVVRGARCPVSLLEIGCPGVAAALALDITARLAPEHPELDLGVGTVGPGTSWVDLRRLGAETLLIVRAGHATTLGLHTIARQLAHAEISAIGAVLVHPDPRDRSDGTLWDGLHTVLRETATNGTAINGTAANGTAQMLARPPARSDNGQSVLEPSSTPDEK